MNQPGLNGSVTFIVGFDHVVHVVLPGTERDRSELGGHWTWRDME